MNKGFVTYLMIPFAIFAMLFFSLKTNVEIDPCQFSVDAFDMDYSVHKDLALNSTKKMSDNGVEACFLSPNLGKSFIGFKEAIAFKESRGSYSVVNTLGYLGKYQFGKGTLKLIGVYNTNDFLNNPKLQEKAFIANAMRNKWILRRDIKRFVGKRIDGILITESGILASAHLAGPGSVKKYLRSYGAIGFADAYGTTVRNYMKKFSGYDTSFITPNRKAKVTII